MFTIDDLDKSDKAKVKSILVRTSSYSSLLVHMGHNNFYHNKNIVSKVHDFDEVKVESKYINVEYLLIENQENELDVFYRILSLEEKKKTWLFNAKEVLKYIKTGKV
jgi:hypothetical protein